MDINRLREILHVQLIVIAILFVMLIVQDAMIVIVIGYQEGYNSYVPKAYCHDCLGTNCGGVCGCDDVCNCDNDCGCDEATGGDSPGG